MEIISKNLDENVAFLKQELKIGQNFDVVYRVIQIGSKRGAICFLDGFCKDEIMQKCCSISWICNRKKKPILHMS